MCSIVSFLFKSLVYSLKLLFPVRWFVYLDSFTNMIFFSYAAMIFVLFCVYALKIIVHVEVMCVAVDFMHRMAGRIRR